MPNYLLCGDVWDYWVPLDGQLAIQRGFFVACMFRFESEVFTGGRICDKLPAVALNGELSHQKKNIYSDPAPCSAR